MVGRPWGRSANLAQGRATLRSTDLCFQRLDFTSLRRLAVRTVDTREDCLRRKVGRPWVRSGDLRVSLPFAAWHFPWIDDVNDPRFGGLSAFRYIGYLILWLVLTALVFLLQGDRWCGNWASWEVGRPGTRSGDLTLRSGDPAFFPDGPHLWSLACFQPFYA